MKRVLTAQRVLDPGSYRCSRFTKHKQQFVVWAGPSVRPFVFWGHSRRAINEILVPHYAGHMTALCESLPLVTGVQGRLFGDQGRPGGSLLDALFRIDSAN